MGDLWGEEWISASSEYLDNLQLALLEVLFPDLSQASHQDMDSSHLTIYS